MSYGFKFKNNSNELIIDDRNVKPWIFSGSYIGLNWKTTEDTANFNLLTDAGVTFYNRNNSPETWRVYEIQYVAPTNANCFVAYKLPNTSSLDIWYSPQNQGSVVKTTDTQYYIPQAGGTYCSTSIYVLVPVSWLSTASEQQILSILPIPYFYSADPIYAPSTAGYGIKVFKEDSTCMYDSAKKHIKLNSYSYGFLEFPNYAGSYGPYIPGTGMSELRKSYTISGSTGDNLGLVLPVSKSRVFNSSTSAMTETRIWYQKNGNVLTTLNPYTSRYTVSPYASGYSTLQNNVRYNMATEVTGILDATTLSDASTRRLYGRVLMLDVAGFDIPYTPTEFPAGYTLSINTVANDPATDDNEYQNLIDKLSTNITLTTFNVPNGTQVPYTITGTNVTAADFDLAYDINRPGDQTISNPLSGYFTVQSNSGSVHFRFKDDNIIEGNETFTLSLTNGKANIGVTIKERKSYTLDIISGTQPDGSVNEGSTIQFRLITKNVLNGTVIPWSVQRTADNVDFNSSDIVGGVMSGNFTVSTTGDTGIAYGSVTFRNDNLTEGPETFSVGAFSGSTVLAYAATTLNDTSAPISYSIRYGTQLQGNIQLNEGDTAVFTIVGQNVPNGTRVYPAFADFGGTDITIFDFVIPNDWYDPAVGLTGVVMNNNIGTFSFQVKADRLTEGVESFIPKIYSTPDNTRTDNILAEWFNGRVFIYDTSVNIPYTISTYVNSVNEGQNFQIDMTIGEYTGTPIYWRMDGIDSSDLTVIYQLDPDGEGGYANTSLGTATSGSFTFDYSLTKSFLVYIRNDQALEGTETLGFSLRQNSSNGTVVASKNITINDTSVPTYNMYNDTIYGDTPYYLTEGQSVRWNISTTGVPSYTYLYWTNAGTTDGADFDDVYGNINYGSVLIVNNAGWFQRTLKNDLRTEGSETIVMQLRTGGNYADGVLRVTDSAITVGDTSTAPTATVYPTSSSVNEGGTVYFVVDTTGITDGTQLYWSNIGNADTADFTDNSNTGSVYIYDSTGTIARTILNDSSTEGPQTIQLRIYTDAARTNLLATSSTVTINDTSRTPVNEIVTVYPSSVVYPSGIRFRVENGTPNDTYYYSVNTYDYDNALTLDGNGYTSSPDYGAAQNFEAGTYTIYVYFAATGHTRQATWTVTAAYPAAGTLLTTFCSGTTKYGTYANGSGGSYNQSIQVNSTDCGYVAPSGPTLSNFILDTNDSGNIDTWGSPSAAYDGLRCKGASRNSIDMYVSRTFTLNQAATITAYFHVSSEQNYDFGELYFDNVLFSRGSGNYESGALSGPISAGTHTVKVRYIKDGSVSSGTDTAFAEWSIT